MHAVSSYRGNRPTNKQTHKHTGMTDYNTLRRSLAGSVINPGYDGLVGHCFQQHLFVDVYGRMYMNAYRLRSMHQSSSAYQQRFADQ